MRTFPFTPSSSDGLLFLVTIQRGLETLRFTTANSSVSIDGTTWTPMPGSSVTNISFPSDGSPATADIGIATKSGGIVEPGDGIGGHLEGWPIALELFDSGNPSAGTFDLIPGATIGQVVETTYGAAVISINGPLNKYRSPATEHFSLTGREDLGDDRCKIPILGDKDIAAFDIARGQSFVRPDTSDGLQRVADAYGRIRAGDTVEDYNNVYFECVTAGTTDASTPPSYDYTIGNTTADGTAEFIARDAWLRAARGQATGDFTIVLDALPDSRASDATWFELGGLFIRSGALSGFEKYLIRAWTPDTLTVTLFRPISPDDIPANTQFEIHAGCDQTPTQCNSRFNNIINIRAEYFVPPPSLTQSL